MKNDEEMIYLYQRKLVERDGYSRKTVECQLRTIHLFQKFIDKPLSLINKDDVLNYKSWLQEHRKIKISSVHSQMVYLKKYYSWFCTKPGYRSKIDSDAVEYFIINRAEKSMLNHKSEKAIPTLDDVLELHRSIKPNTEINLRNRAIIAIATTAGLREGALITLRKGNIDDDLFICQDPENGVKTKYSKKIWTLAFDFHQELTDSIREWKKKLDEKKFSESDPFFPKFTQLVESDQNALFPFIKEATKSFLSNPNVVNQIFQRLCKKAGLKYFHPHSYRHRWAMMGFENSYNGTQIRALSESAGHEEITTLLKSYGHFTVPELKAQLLNINDNISKKGVLNPKEFQFIELFSKALQLYPEIIEKIVG